MNAHFFTIIIVTYPKCQIMQQSHIDILQTGERFPIFLFKTKNENNKSKVKIISLPRV